MSVTAHELPAVIADNPELDSWIRVDAGGTVTAFTGRVELGQGVRTAMRRIAAEELDLPVELVRVETADSSRGPDEGWTVGSRSMSEGGSALRVAAAEARARLVDRAAAELGADAAGLSVEDGRIVAPDGRATSYWELLGGGRFDCTISGEARPRAAGARRPLGRPGERVDLPGIVTGSTRIIQDLDLPGMLHARVVRPEGPLARLESIDVGRAAALEGVVEVVRDGSFVGVIAEREEQAVAAAELLRARARWAEEETLPPATRLSDWLVSQPTVDYHVVDGNPVAEPLPPLEDPPGAARTLEASYSRPYLMHGSIGPSAGAAEWTPDGELTVWMSGQGPFVLRRAIAEALRLDPARVRTIHVESAGCYGHNGSDDAAFDAALLARRVPGRPVLVKWTRADEHGWEPYGPPAVVRTRASLDADGRLLDFNVDAWGTTHNRRADPYGERSMLLAAGQLEQPVPAPPPEPMLLPEAGIHRNATPLYSVPRRRIVKHFVKSMPLRSSSLRALGAHANVFAIESFMDELALAAGADPLEFRLAHLGDERARAVLEAAAERAGWRAPREREFGRGRGIGLARYKNRAAWAAVIVDLVVDDATAAARVERAVIAADAGEVVDPDGLANQLEGGVVQSASWTLKEAVRFDRTRVTSLDWESYPILGFEEAPEVETVLIDRPGLPFLGAGEATQGPTAGAIANAAFDAIGVRLRDMPFTPERIRAAVAAAG